jgi:hypothetical protein
MIIKINNNNNNLNLQNLQLVKSKSIQRLNENFQNQDKQFRRNIIRQKPNDINMSNFQYLKALYMKLCKRNPNPTLKRNLEVLNKFESKIEKYL